MSKEWSAKQGKITLEELGLTQENQGRFVDITEEFQALVISLKAFRIPKEAFQLERFTMISLRSL